VCLVLVQALAKMQMRVSKELLDALAQARLLKAVERWLLVDSDINKGLSINVGKVLTPCRSLCLHVDADDAGAASQHECSEPRQCSMGEHCLCEHAIPQLLPTPHLLPPEHRGSYVSQNR